DGPDTSSGAPTLLAADDDGSRTRSGKSMLGREIIGQYVIVDKLGEGGMGEVYLADQPAIGRQVAIKVVHGQTRESDHDDHVARFRNEAKAAASLESAHIVSIFNWGELEDGTLFMAMEYLPGRTLADLIRKEGPLEPFQAVTIAGQICTALSEAHGAGIIHRDLKPSNIMLLERKGEQNEGESLFAKVLDFGVAKLEGSDITRSGAMFGTPQYMSPEQLRGDAIDGRSDLYSLGIMLYEMLVGKLPFSSPTAVGFITAHLHDTPPALPKTVPKALAEVVMQLLAKSADERPPSAEAAADELWAALGGRDTRAGRRARQRGRRRALRRTVAAVIVLGVLGGGGYGGWWMWQQQQEMEAELERKRAEAVRL
ncbi:MAG: serine/threonine protein kinase, partial [Myxococcales bacterium]|nr:serine/threonine protein kinase [Myxococcales bacterium]